VITMVIIRTRTADASPPGTQLSLYAGLIGQRRRPVEGNKTNHDHSNTPSPRSPILSQAPCVPDHIALTQRKRAGTVNTSGDV